MLLNLKKWILQFCLLCHCVWSFISTVTNYRNVTSVDEHILMFLRPHNNGLCVCGQMFGIRNHWFLLLFFWTPWLEMHITEDFHIIEFFDVCLSMYTVVIWTLYTLQWCQQKWKHGNFLIKIPTVIEIHLTLKIFIVIFMAWTSKIRQLKLMWISWWLFPCMWSIHIKEHVVPLCFHQKIKNILTVSSPNQNNDMELIQPNTSNTPIFAPSSTVLLKMPITSSHQISTSLRIFRFNAMFTRASPNPPIPFLKTNLLLLSHLNLGLPCCLFLSDL